MSTHSQTTVHPSSHHVDDGGEGGGNGHPSDSETALQKKFYAAFSEDRDQTEQMSDSETPCPVSGCTRSKSKRRCGAVEHRNHSTGSPGDHGDSERPTDRGGRATKLCDVVLNSLMG